MTKDDCPAFLPLFEDCGVDWQPCPFVATKGVGCTKSLKIWEGRQRIQGVAKLQPKDRPRPTGHRPVFIQKAQEIIDLMEEHNFEYIPARADLELLKYEHPKATKNMKYLEYLKEKTGKPTKKEWLDSQPKEA